MPIYITILKIIVTIGFLLAGIAKLLGAKPIVDQFREFKLPVKAMYLVGILEVSGAIALYCPTLALASAIGLALLMVGVIANHLKVKHPFSKYLPSFILFILTALLALFLKQQGYTLPFGLNDALPW